MCGRYVSTSTDKELQSMFDIMQTVGDEVPPFLNYQLPVKIMKSSNRRTATLQC
jgi:hypothetical protein